MSKKVVLSETQFKNYMRRLLKENTAGEQINMNCSLMAERLRKFANYIEKMGDVYIHLYDLTLSEIKNMGFNILNVQEKGNFLYINVDPTNVQVPEDNVDISDYVSTELEYTLRNSENSQLYFNKPMVWFQNNVIEIDMDPDETFDLEKINNYLPDL